MTRLGYAIDVAELLARWKRDEAQGHKIMPMIEAAHIGPIPLEAVPRAFRVGKDNPTFVQVWPEIRPSD